MVAEKGGILAHLEAQQKEQTADLKARHEVDRRTPRTFH
jgi:hypothetical protein